jgi:hypothetical protein
MVLTIGDKDQNISTGPVEEGRAGQGKGGQGRANKDSIHNITYLERQNWLGSENERQLLL